MPGFTIKFLIALLLLGPFLAAGLCVTARRRLAGEKIGIRASFALHGQRRSSLALFGLLLIFIRRDVDRCNRGPVCGQGNDSGTDLERLCHHPRRRSRPTHHRLRFR
jgi:hypothetical protein